MELTRGVEQLLKTKGVHTKQLKMNGAAFSKVSEDAVLYSKMSSLSDVRSEFSRKASAPETIKMKPSLHMSSEMARIDVAAPASMSTSRRGAEYSVETDEINTEQAYRMVSKVLNSKKK